MLALQSKKQAEEEAARELNELFAQAIKQPKVPLGEALVPSHDPTLPSIWWLADVDNGWVSS